MIDYRYRAFNKDWFKKRQGILLWLLNHPILKYYVRDVMGIKKGDSHLKVLEIQPNNIKYYLGGRRVQAKFSSDNYFYSKYIYFRLKELWLLLHQWDELFADKYIPELSFGFDTLVVNPDADPESTSVDGYVYRQANGDTWTNIRTGAGTTATDSSESGGPALVAYTTLNGWYRLYRGITLFDTSSLGTGAKVNSALLDLTQESQASGFSTTPDFDIVSSNPASNTAIAASDYDYNDFGTTVFASCSYAEWVLDTPPYRFDLNASGIAAVSLTGITKYGQRLSWDTDNSPPTWFNSGQTYMRHWYADDRTNDPANAPELTIDYDPPAGTTFHQMML